MTLRAEREEARDNIAQAGARMANRIAGMLEREAGRLLDQFHILYKESTQVKIKKQLWASFLKELDSFSKGTKKKE